MRSAYLPIASRLTQRNKREVTDRKWEEGDDLSVSEFKATEYGRARGVVASEDVKNTIREIGINKCARESGFDRKNFIRKLARGIPVKRNSYNEFVRWLDSSALLTPGPGTRCRERKARVTS